jgi:hypothetical protein
MQIANHIDARKSRKKQPVKMSIHSLVVFSDAVDIEIAARNHRMPC